jgi:hypothetical protein
MGLKTIARIILEPFIFMKKGIDVKTWNDQIGGLRQP